jgi:hypothetical protein
MKVELQTEHHWLQKLVGEWKFHSECPTAPGEPPCTSEGTDSVRSIGGAWILAEGRGPMPGGGDANWILTLGFDPQKKRFVGTWIGSMMTHLWVYDGELNAAGTTLTLNAQGPKMTAEGLGEGTANYREVIEFKGDDHRTFTSFVQGDDGKWMQIMHAEYRRHGK